MQILKTTSLQNLKTSAFMDSIFFTWSTQIHFNKTFILPNKVQTAA